MRKLGTVLVVAATLVAAGAAIADITAPGLYPVRVKGGTTQLVLGAHKDPGIGAPSANEHKGFLLAIDPQAASKSASVGIKVVTKSFSDGQKISLKELGFDLFTPGGFDTFDRGSLCGASLRFVFANSSGGQYSLSCSQGTHSDLGNGWTRVRYTSANDQDVATLAGPAWPGFGSAQVTSVQLVSDGSGGGGVDIVDNIDVNGVLWAN